MKTWKELFVNHMLKRRGLMYYGPEEEILEQVQAHHPWIIEEADRLTKMVEDKIAHDAVFKAAS